jgi:hypothetical protein
MNWEALEAISSAVTALGVFIAAYQIGSNRMQNKTRFEDELAREYRDLGRAISLKALLGEELTDEEFLGAKIGLWHYIDLSNEQVFLRQQKRISKKTWNYWREGIQCNLSRPAFRKAWEQIKATLPHDFTELQRLERTAFKDDPAKWGTPSNSAIRKSH